MVSVELDTVSIVAFYLDLGKVTYFKGKNFLFVECLSQVDGIRRTRSIGCHMDQS